jgi:hypothetical protein
LSGRSRTQAALSGEDDVGFAPLLWAELPAFVQATAPGEFWLDAGATHRMLTDASGVCASEAVLIPIWPGGPSRDQVGHPDDVVALPGVGAAVDIISRIAAVGDIGSMAVLPLLSELAGLFPNAPVEDLEDCLTDLTRAALEGGADAVVVRGSGEGVSATVDAVSGLAAFYGTAALGAGGGIGWAAAEVCPVAVLGRDGGWPAVRRGIVLTAGDLTEWWTPDEVRAVVRSRGVT